MQVCLQYVQDREASVGDRRGMKKALSEYANEALLAFHIPYYSDSGKLIFH